MSEPPIEPRMLQSPPGPHVQIGGRRYLYFGGTSYLGLHGRSEVIAAGCTALQQLGVHTATTRAAFGNAEPVVDLEREAAAFFGAEAAVTLPSGYLTAIALLKTVAADYDVLLVDRASHYAVNDAAKVAGLPVRSFATCDVHALTEALANLDSRARPLVLTDGLFPMGRIAPLDRYTEPLDRFARAGMLIDDAHGVGILGEHGRGTAEHRGFATADINRAAGGEGVAIYVGGTLSKALGGYGGVIAGEAAFIDRIRRDSGVFVGASGLPNPVAAAGGQALRIVRDEGRQLRQHLRRTVRQLREGLSDLALAVDRDSPSPIIAVELGDARRMQAVHEALRDRGLLVPYIAKYSGAGQAGALRIAACAGHTPQMVEQLLTELRSVL